MSSSERLRLLLFLNSSSYGGVEEVVLSLVKRLDRSQFEVHLAAPAPLLEAFRPELDDCEVSKIALYLVSWRQWGEIARLLRYLREHRIQIVNCHLFYATLFAAPLARLAGVPVVIETTHGPETWRRGWWKRMCLADRLVEKLVTMNIAVSEANRRYLLREKRFPCAKLKVVPNGRDLNGYLWPPEKGLASLRRRHGIQDHHRVLVTVGRLEPQKGHQFLLAALPRVLKQFPSVRLICVGDGSLRPKLDAQVAAEGLRENVIFTGFSRPVAPYYHLAEFVVLPSLYEGMPLVAIEAGAAGRAVVATAVDGTGEVVVDGQTGALVPPSSPAALATAICRLLGDPEKARGMGAAARARVERLFSLERQVEQTTQLYRSCFAGRGSAGFAWRSWIRAERAGGRQPKCDY